MRGHAEFCLLGAASYLLLVGKIESLNLSDDPPITLTRPRSGIVNAAVLP
jgi:hypothetical protein